MSAIRVGLLSFNQLNTLILTTSINIKIVPVNSSILYLQVSLAIVQIGQLRLHSCISRFRLLKSCFVSCGTS